MNLLPKNGLLIDHGLVMQNQIRVFNNLNESIFWEQDEVVMFGKRIKTKRMMAWYGDEGVHYKYSGINRFSLPWFDELLLVKKKVELITGSKYNSCLLNRYQNGEEAMGYHADNESDLVRNGSIASLSLGATRKFVFKHNTTKEKIEIILHSGQLIEMKGEIQQYWKHALPKTKKVTEPRINLTFRQINK